MEKVTIACLSNERQTAVKRLQALGAFHAVNMTAPNSDELDGLKRLREQTAHVLNVLKNTLLDGKCAPNELNQFSFNSAEATVQRISDTLETARREEEELAQAKKNIVLLEPWGTFSQESINKIAAHGLNIVLCASPAGRIPEMPQGAVVSEICEKAGVVYYAVLSQENLEDSDLPKVSLPQNTSIEYWKEREKAIIAATSSRSEAILTEARDNFAMVTRLAEVIEERIIFAQARDGMSTSGNISFVRGYIPSSQIDSLRAVAHQCGWAIRYEEVPEDDTDVPTKLDIPKPFKMAQTIFDFVGILPGYRENDVSICMVVFLSIFCGMLVGDAGYGTIFTLLTLYFRKKAKTDEARTSLNLLLTMSATILIYGILTCNWFAIPVSSLPSWMNICPWMCNNDANIQLLSFFLGAFHMSLARVWRAILAAKKIKLSEDDTKAFLSKIREALGHVGWGVFLWANFGMTRLLIVKGGSVGDLETPFIWMYIIGFIMILVFSVDWTDMGTVIYMPFTFINNFVDVLSYIRLFAVGLSGLYIANSFNSMAMGLHSLNMPWLTIPAAVLILALGHALNVSLALMGVLVHGIRLNTLEFSGHMDLTWSGKRYKPLKSTESNS